MLINQDVIKNGAFFIANEIVSNLPRFKIGTVVGTDHLKKTCGIWAVNFKPAHMANIKNPGVIANCSVLINNGCVLDGHIPAAKINHACPIRRMPRMKRCL